MGLLLWARRDHRLTLDQSAFARGRARALERGSELARENERLTVARDLALRGIDPVAVERRRRFAANAEKIVVNLDLCDHNPLEGTLVDLGFHEAVMRVPGDVDLGRGAVARLSVWVPEDDHSSSFDVVIKSRHAVEGGTELGLHMAQIDRLRELPKRLSALMKDRDAPRIAPAPAQPMVATLRVGSQAAAGQVRDISATGVGVVVQQSLAKVSAWGTRAEVLLLLPGAPGPLFIEARVTRLYSVAGGTLLGMRFSEADAPKVAGVVAELLAQAGEPEPKALSAAG